MRAWLWFNVIVCFNRSGVLTTKGDNSVLVKFQNSAPHKIHSIREDFIRVYKFKRSIIIEKP